MSANEEGKGQNVRQDPWLRVGLSAPRTHEELALVDVFAPAVGVFHLLAEDEGHLEKEEVALSTLADQSLRVPNLKGLLKDELTLGLDVFIKSWRGKKKKRSMVLAKISKQEAQNLN